MSSRGSEDSENDGIKVFFSASEWEKLSGDEKKCYRDEKWKYDTIRRCGWTTKPPAFMTRKPAAPERQQQLHNHQKAKTSGGPAPGEGAAAFPSERSRSPVSDSAEQQAHPSHPSPDQPVEGASTGRRISEPRTSEPEAAGFSTPELRTPTPEPRTTPTPEPRTPELWTPTPGLKAPTPEPRTPTPEPRTPEPRTPTPEPMTPTSELRTPEPRTPDPQLSNLELGTPEIGTPEIGTPELITLELSTLELDSLELSTPASRTSATRTSGPKTPKSKTPVLKTHLGLGIDEPKTSEPGKTSEAPRYPKRAGSRKTYKELELQDDDFLFCDDCRTEYAGDCPEHGPLQVIPDTKVAVGRPDRALLTVPPQLAVEVSKIPGAGRGVWTREAVPRRVRFGPYEGDTVRATKETGYGWEIRRDGKPTHCVDALNMASSNWLRFVNCARHSGEVNLVPYQYQGHVYYRTVRDVPANTELLTWYGES
ncbi:hypothetical protein FOCC_FOCC008705, partial [Frankliniella occidentalis]